MKVMNQLKDKLRQKEFYPLSPMQEGMLFHTLYAPGSGVYVEQVCYRLQGRIDQSALARAWQATAKRHPVLRTCFIWEDIKTPVQWVQPEAAIPIEVLDWREVSGPEQGERLEHFLKSDRAAGFNLAKAPLMRLTLVWLADDRYELVWTWHHLLMDGWSSSLVTKEVFAFYEAFCSGRDLKLKESRPYRDYIAWLRKQDLKEAEAYWRRQLAGFTAATPLIVDRSVAGTPDKKTYDERHTLLSAATTEALQSFARKHRLTLNTVVQGAWALLCSRYSGERDVVFGSVVSGRPVDLAGVESMVGLFINTLPVRARVDSTAELVSWLKQLQADQIAARRYEYTPLIEVQGWTSVPRNQPLFETLVVFEAARYEAASSNRPASSDDLQVEDVINYEQINYPLALVAVPASTMFLQIMFECGRIGAATASRMLEHLRHLLESMVSMPEARLDCLPILSDNERRQTIDEWNDSARAYERERSLHELIERQVERSPEEIAVIFEGRQMTYRELDGKSNQLAHYLRGQGIGPDQLVGILMERSPEMLVALLATLKAGAAYVPLDPAYPKERLNYILKDAGVAALLTEQRLLGSTLEHSAPIICLDGEWDQVASQSPQKLVAASAPDNLAYVIYTSGSTGNPRGVQIPHRAIVNFIESMRYEPGCNRQETLLAVTTLSFDIAALELFLPLAVGGRLVIASRELASDGAQLAEALDKYGVTMMQATPATWRSMIDAGWQGSKGLKVLCGGEALPRDLADQLLERSGELWNMYGPTETTVWSTLYRVEAGSGPVSIGRPIANTQIYLVDTNLQPVPVGVAGELCIGGDGVARGYFGRPELTADKFIPDPFSQAPGQRLYRTGDAARYLDDGRIEYVGRLDFQMKVRGFRIEAGEIESVLARHPAVSESAVITREDAPGDQQLVAYLVAHGDAEPAAGELRSFLKQTLPDYMIPSRFVAMQKLPLTPNGKVDRRALPAPSSLTADIGLTYIAPRSLLEHKLAHIWEEIFNLRPIGVTDNFFDLGGHSLLAVRVMAQVHKQLGQRLPLSLLFEATTIEKLAAALLQQTEPAVTRPLVAIQPEGDQRPFFCVHPIGGQVLVYQQLARCLGSEQPFYALQAPEFTDIGAAYISIEEMAAHYIQAIREVQPEGPYLLGGYSFGGYVAFEMARQLTRQAQPVSLLAILDTWSPSLYQRLPEEDDEVFLLTMLARVRARQQGRDLILSAEEIRHLGPDERLLFVLEQVKKAGLLDDNITAEVGIPYIRSYMTGYKTRQKAIFQYVPEVYPGRITLLRCAEEDQEALESLQRFGGDTSDPSFGWSALSPYAVDVRTVPGFHERMLQPPYVDAVAEGLKACINDAACAAHHG
jgi:amino acid adenylation domain-containing protein